MKSQGLAVEGIPAGGGSSVAAANLPASRDG